MTVSAEGVPLGVHDVVPSQITTVVRYSKQGGFPYLSFVHVCNFLHCLPHTQNTPACGSHACAAPTGARF